MEKTNPQRIEHIKKHHVVAVPMWLLFDLIAMARHSKQYRDGTAWTAIGMNEANRIYNGALVRGALGKEP